MKNTYWKDKSGTDLLILDCDGFHPTKVGVGFDEVFLYTDGYEDCDINQIYIDRNSWEEFKAFVDNQIAMKGGKNE